MKFNNHIIQIPCWIATHSYLVFTEESRSYITNERDREYTQLDDLSSDFWYLIGKDDSAKLSSFISEKGLSVYVEDFLQSLYSLGLIILDGKTYHKEKQQKQESNKENDSDDENFIVERNDWIWGKKQIASILLELTYRCNLRCIHCYNPKDQSECELDFEEAKKIIDEAYELGCYEVTLTGGESTTYTHFIELCRYIREKKMGLTVFTNGQNLWINKELYHELVHLYPHEVAISLYSNQEINHDKVTAVAGSFNKSKEVIENLRKDGVNVQIKNFLLNFVCHDCVEVKKFADQIGAHCVTDVSLIPTIQGDKKTLIYELSEDDLFFLYSNPESPLYLGKRNALFDYEKNKDTSPCLGGFNSLTITPNGDYKICVSMPSVLGNHHMISLAELWRGAMLKDKNNALYQWQCVTNGDLKECYKHDYCRFCHYCAGMAMLENGYLKHSDVLCKQARAKQKAYIHLQSQNNN